MAPDKEPVLPRRHRSPYSVLGTLWQVAKLVCAEVEEDAALALSVAGQGSCSCEMIKSVV